jgi:hypothetical protein
MLCASEAHEPKNVIHQMRIEQINRLEGFAISIHASAKQCKRLCHGAATAKLEQLKQSCDTYTLTWASRSVHFGLVGGMPDWHSKDSGQEWAHSLVKRVIQEKCKDGRRGLNSVLRAPHFCKKVN